MKKEIKFANGQTMIVEVDEPKLELISDCWITEKYGYLVYKDVKYNMIHIVTNDKTYRVVYEMLNDKEIIDYLLK